MAELIGNLARKLRFLRARPGSQIGPFLA